jgi:hypothetical protein
MVKPRHDRPLTRRASSEKNTKENKPMIAESFARRKYKELSQSGTFRWERARGGLPEVIFTPNNPNDQVLTGSAEDFIDNVLAGELARFARSAQNLRAADLDPRAGSPGVADREPQPNKVRVSGERNENWNGAIRSSRGRSYSASLEMERNPAEPNRLAEAFSLDGVTSMKTLSVDSQALHTESMELLKNTSQELEIAVHTSSEGRHVYQMGPDGRLKIA